MAHSDLDSARAASASEERGRIAQKLGVQEAPECS